MFKLYSIYNSKRGQYGLPFPGNDESMRRDIRESLKGFDEDFYSDFKVVEIGTFDPCSDENPFVSAFGAEIFVKDIMAEEIMEVSADVEA